MPTDGDSLVTPRVDYPIYVLHLKLTNGIHALVVNPPGDLAALTAAAAAVA